MMCVRLCALLSAELFVLIAAIFLLVYITKQQVSKWFTYSSVSIIIVMLMIMVCTICCAMCMRHCGPRGMERECRMEERCGPGPMMMHRMHGGCPHEMMGEGNCENEMKECDMKEEGGDMPCCKKGMHKEKCMEKEISISVSDKDSIIQKEVTVKKK